MDEPLSIVLGIVIKDNKILLIRRIRGDYIGLWGLPGGKVEKNEHLQDAVSREIFEESGIESEFRSHLGVVSEHLIENGEIIQHFLLNLCELIPKTADLATDIEGKLEWFDLDNLEKIKEKIIPSDFVMIEKIIKNREKNYYDCIIEKSGENHILRKFE